MAIQIQKLPQLISKYISALSPKKPSEVPGQRRIGLNIGRANMVACEISSQGDQLTLEHCARKRIVKEKSITQQVKELFQEEKFQAKQVNISLKGQGVIIRFLTFPRMNRSDFASAIQYEAEKYLPFNLSEVALDCHIVNGSGGGGQTQGENTMQVILAAARKTEVNKLISIAQEAKLKLGAIDVDVFAYANAFEFSNPEAKAHSVGLIDFGAVDTTLAILDKGRLTFSRDIAFGGNDLTEMVHRKLNVSLEAAAKVQYESHLAQGEEAMAIEEGLSRLFYELRSSLNYYYNQHQNAAPLETAYIAGGFSQLSVLPQMLEKQMELPVKKWDPLNHLKIGASMNPEVLKVLAPCLPVSIGLAIRSK